MPRVLSLVIGSLIGLAVIAAAIFILNPERRAAMRQRLEHGWQEAMTEARRASQTRRAELQRELDSRPPG